MEPVDLWEKNIPSKAMALRWREHSDFQNSKKNARVAGAE